MKKTKETGESGTSADWMQALAAKFESSRRAHPNDRLLILFDVDGTILDMRHWMLHCLRSYDAEHGTQWFSGLTPSDVHVHEDAIETLLSERGLDGTTTAEIVDHYLARRWMPESILASHRPFRGVMEVIRWFQLQPNTFVGLNTGRPESLRDETLRSLNVLGREYRVWFDDDRLRMNPRSWGEDVEDGKVEAIRQFQEDGYRIIAFIDNEPANLEAVARWDVEGEILLLHADTIFRSQRERLPEGTTSGQLYDPASLVEHGGFGPHVHFVWENVNGWKEIWRYLDSNVRWAELDVRCHPRTGELVLRKEPFGTPRPDASDDLVWMDEVLPILRKHAAFLRLNLHDGIHVLEPLAEALARHRIDPSTLWFHGEIGTLGEAGFRWLRPRYPDAVLQCPLSFLAPLLESAPEPVHGILKLLREWGINRVAAPSSAPGLATVSDRLERRGFELHVEGVPNLEAFLKSVLLSPRSVGSTFAGGDRMRRLAAIGERASIGAPTSRAAN